MFEMRYSKSVLFAFVCFALLVQSSAQLIGVDICACLPTTVTFRLNFTFECDASNVFGPGINDTTCLIDTRGNENVTDFVPTGVSTVQIFELNEDLEVVGESTSDDGFFDGSEITYTSIVIRNPANVSTPEKIPRGFQISITGVNAAEQTIVNLVAITYTGECGIFPLLEVGEQIGWVLFVDLGDPSEDFCPTSTSRTPIIAPTIAPLTLLSDMPSNSPALPVDSEIPSSVPTVSPLSVETEAPIEAPTDVIAPSCPPIENGGKSGIVNGGSGVADKYNNKKATEDMDRNLRTGGGQVECPESPSQQEVSKKKIMTKDNGEKSPKEDVVKVSKDGKKKDKEPKKKVEDKAETGKGTKSPKVSNAKGENNNATMPDSNTSVGKGRDDDSLGKGELPKKKVEGKHTGTMDVSNNVKDNDKKSASKADKGKGTKSTKVSKGKSENATASNATMPGSNGMAGKGRGDDSVGKEPSHKTTKGSTEDRDEE